MKKVFVLTAVVTLLVPAFALANFNDVTLTTDANILVGSYTLNVSGSSAAVQSITVNPGSFSVTLASGSSITVSSPTFQQLSSDVTSDVTNNTCTASQSSIALAYSGAGTVTNIITPSATVCAGSGSSGGSGGGGSGGGGGLIVGSGALAPGYINVNPTSTTTITESIKSGNGTAVVTPNQYKFLKNLQYRITNADVLQLQEYLNTHGFVLAKTGPGSPGSETDYFGIATYTALIKFQEAHAADILTPNGLTKGSGYFGPSTRAFIAEH